MQPVLHTSALRGSRWDVGGGKKGMGGGEGVERERDSLENIVPPINNHLRGEETRATAKVDTNAFAGRDRDGKTKVDELDLSCGLVKEYILRLEVTMADLLAVEKVDRPRDALHDTFGHLHRRLLGMFAKVVKEVVSSLVHEDVEVLFRL